MSKGISAGTNLFSYCNNDPVNYLDTTGFAKSRINFGAVFGKVSIVSAVLSAIGTLSLIAFRKTPWGKKISLAITFASVATNVYSYSKAVNSAIKYYGKNSSKYKQLLKYNNIILQSNIAFMIICEVLSKSIVKKYSATVAVALIGCRTITISGMAINIAELLSGKSIIYRNRLRS